MTDHINGLPPEAAKTAKQILKAYEKQGIKYRVGRPSKTLMKRNRRHVYALDFFDHGGVLVKSDGKKIPFIEPYNGLSADQVKQLTKFCKRRKLEFSVSVLSPWFPGRTLMVMFHEREGVKPGEKES